MTRHSTPLPPATAFTRPARRRRGLALVGGLATVVFTACSAGVANGPDQGQATNPGNGSSSSTSPAAGGSANAMLSTLDLAALDTHFDADDLTWDTAEEQTITLDDDASSSDSDAVTIDGSTVTITEAGVYRVAGALTDGQLVVAEQADEAVRLILDGVEIDNSAGSAIAVQSANEVTIVLEEGSTNRLADGADYTVADDATPVGALASDVDLTIAGTGALEVTGNANDAISSRDGLVIASGTITVQGADDGIRGQHYLSILDGTLNVTADGDALKSDEFEDPDRGWVYVAGGTLTAIAGDDGIDAEQAIQIVDGAVDIQQSTEGIEAQNVMIDGGTVAVQATDDGINTNAATPPGSTADEAEVDARNDDGSQLSISGGTVEVTGGDDGLDSNGSISLTGGDITITSPESGRGTGPVDANGEVVIEGVTVLANGRELT